MIMEFTKEETPGNTAAWSSMSYSEKNQALYDRQVALLQLFLEKHAIDRTQYEKSLADLTAKFNH